MSRSKRFWQTLAAGNMEFFCLYTIIVTATYFINQRGFPLLSSFLVFWMAFVLTSLLRKRRLYTFLIVLIHMPGYLLAALLILASFYKPSSSLGELDWITSILSAPGNLADTAVLILILAGVTLLWAFGTILAIKEIRYKNTIKYFENSIFIIFFTTLFIGLVEFHMPQLPLYILNVFLWGILAIALGKNSSWESGRRNSAGKLISIFAVGTIISIVTILLFFMDYLHWIADQGFEIVKTAVKPISPYLLNTVKFIFGRMGYENTSPASASPNSLGETISDYGVFGAGGGSELIYKILLGLLVFMMICVAAVLVVMLFRWLGKMLLTKRGYDVENSSLTKTLGQILDELLALAAAVWIGAKTLFSAKKNRSTVEKIYRKLTIWGTFHGIERSSSETPHEYAQRLGDKYSHFADEFHIITEYFCQEIYGDQKLTPADELSLKRAWKHIGRIHWFPS